MKNLSIVHIEDEYREFLSLSTTVKTMIEDYWRLSKDLDVIAIRTKIAESKAVPQEWVVFEMKVDEEPEHTFRYIFVRDAKIPEEVLEFLLEERAFILDVLRPMEGRTTLGISVEDSLQSIEPHITNGNNVILFTAHQGNGLEGNRQNVPRKISKESQAELEDFLSALIVASFEDG
ncbi:hypothetical protein [Ruegeria faecimaris]|uniref:hypothetical protein n=1 Tax=Ruegeria faecimaris TaxID=686389 RepID=UPI00232A8FF1|nr:hypothetical protein [Ruegeria faecimaris]